MAPDRWRQSITVLLEKVFGVRLIDKLRAICLLEADFNWLNKLIFAHRLEQHCRKHGLVPAEQFAKSRTTCEEASLVKNLICDNSRILHNSLSITSVDMDQCFDRAQSSIAGVAARAHGVSQKSTDLMLKTMQMMQYFVKSGFGVADKPSFEGTPLELLMGLGQGSGAAPMGMRGVVTLAVNSYKTLGHGMSAKMSRTQRVVLLAAIVYVDDTDLIHWGDFYGISDSAFLSRIQRAINDWGKLLQATGGSIKKAKSFYYVMSWKFVKGKPTLKTIPELHADELTIPQPDGTSAAIPACPNDHSAKTLGTWNNPNNDGIAPLASLREKGLEWVDQLQTRPLERSLTWLSLKCQKNAQWSYGLSSNYARPSDLDATMGRVYFQALPYLGFNRCITTEFRTLPVDYQGIGMKKWSIEKLAKDITTLIRHWQTDSTLGQVLQLVYESFQMEVGLDGNVLTRSYEKLGHLASHSWFKVLWQYSSLYKVQIALDPKYLLTPTRQGDKPLVELFIEHGYKGVALERLNRVRRFHCVHSLADILCADGITVDPAIFSTSPGHSSRTFSWEQPTKADFEAWKISIRTITSANLTYSPPLGGYKSPPHIPYYWLASPNNAVLYHLFPNGGYDYFTPDSTKRTTRSGSNYTKKGTAPGFPPATHYASIRNYTSNQVTLHSTVPMYQSPSNKTSFINYVYSLRNQSLWNYLEIDDDGEWLLPSLLSGHLVICNDGSYMPKLSKTSCSGAFILHCSATGKEIKGCFSDDSPNGDNYRGELLGGLGPLLLLKAALASSAATEIDQATIQLSSQSLYCDNKGVISHGNDPTATLRSEQPQADLIRLLKSYTRELPCKITWIHVKGHADDNIPFEELSLPQQLNVRCDEIAKIKLIDAIADGDFIDPTFPFEDITITINNTKVRSSVKTAIYKHWGAKEAKRLFSRRDKVLRSAFDNIYWDCIGKVMSEFPETFQGWVTRHISDFNGCNRYQARWNRGVKNNCPSCGRPNEDTEHITRCTDPTRTALYHDGVSLLKTWLLDNHTPRDITMLYTEYLNGRGSTTMTLLLPSDTPPDLPLCVIARIQDGIGFDNLLVVRLPRALVNHMAPILNAKDIRGVSAELWARKLSRELIIFTHKQWTYRNGVVHYTPSENMTVSEHEAIDEQLQSLLSLSPDDLLPHHRHLLTAENFTDLASGPSIEKLYWMAEVRSAVDEAAIAVRLQKLKPKKTKTTTTSSDGKIKTVYNINSTLIPPHIPKEPDLKWKKRRQK